MPEAYFAYIGAPKAWPFRNQGKTLSLIHQKREWTNKESFITLSPI
jgi:hypothetical protein